MFSKNAFLIFCILGAILLAGCNSRATITAPTAAPANATPTFTPVPPTDTPTPTATPEPLAATVNGEGITLAEFETELRQLQEAQAALGKPIDEAPDKLAAQEQQVLDYLIETLLLAQGAREAGYTVDEAALQAEITRLGGPDALAAWMAARGYTEATFRAALERQMAAAWQRDQIAAAVPNEAEQIHARQILTLDEAAANRALSQVRTPGVNFAAQAYAYDPLTGGDLGWFPRGYLTQPVVEEAVFALQPGEISEIIQSDIGYHILYVVGREPARPISPDARNVVQQKAIQNWLETRRMGSQVEILVP